VGQQRIRVRGNAREARCSRGRAPITMRTTFLKLFPTALLLSLVIAAGYVRQADAATGGCFEFRETLQSGSRGPEVRAIQFILSFEGFAVSTSELQAASLGSTTAAALRRFQEKYAKDILQPVGLSRGTGTVGIRTRAKLNALYGCAAIAAATPMPAPTSTPTPTPAPAPSAPTSTPPAAPVASAPTSSAAVSTSTVPTVFTPPSGSPSIASIAPSSAAVGATVTITGSNFSASDNAVHFASGIFFNVPSADGRTLVFALPAMVSLCDVSNLLCGSATALGVATYQLYVSTGNGPSNSVLFTVTAQPSSLAPSQISQTASILESARLTLEELLRSLGSR